MKSITKLSALFLLLTLFVSCKPKGDAAETTAEGEVAATTGTNYTVDAASSMLMWEGAKLAGKHNGTVNVTSGTIVTDGTALQGGEFTIDMTSITVADLTGDQKANLESHLKGAGTDNADDFFNVSKYPTAKFEITKATQLLNDVDANYIINGNLTIKDVTKQVSFKAKAEINDSGVTVKTPPFTIDRTEWGIKYGSATFFDGLKDKAIDNDMGFQIKLMAKS